MVIASARGVFAPFGSAGRMAAVLGKTGVAVLVATVVAVLVLRVDLVGVTVDSEIHAAVDDPSPARPVVQNPRGPPPHCCLRLVYDFGPRPDTHSRDICSPGTTGKRNMKVKSKRAHASTVPTSCSNAERHTCVHATTITCTPLPPAVPRTPIPSSMHTSTHTVHIYGRTAHLHGSSTLSNVIGMTVLTLEPVA